MIVLQHRTHYTERCIEVRPLSVRQIGIGLSVKQAGIYRAFPPDTLITCPVIILACALAKNKIVSAMSSG